RVYLSLLLFTTPNLFLLGLSLYHFAAFLVLRSFPTRRSSDLMLSHILPPPFRCRGPAEENCDYIRTVPDKRRFLPDQGRDQFHQDRKSTRLNSSHVSSSYAVFCLTKKQTPWMPTPSAGWRNFW